MSNTPNALAQLQAPERSLRELPAKIVKHALQGSVKSDYSTARYFHVPGEKSPEGPTERNHYEYGDVLCAVFSSESETWRIAAISDSTLMRRRKASQRKDPHWNIERIDVSIW